MKEFKREIKISKIKNKKVFKGYNKPHQCHQNSYYFCASHKDCKFVCGLLNKVTPHCIVKLPNGKYVDPTLNEEDFFIVLDEYSFVEIKYIFDKEKIYFIPSEWTTKSNVTFRYKHLEKEIAQIHRTVKKDDDFSKYNTTEKSEYNAYVYCLDNPDCNFICIKKINGEDRCIVQLPNGEYIDPTNNEEYDFFIDAVYTTDEICYIFVNENAIFFPNIWAIISGITFIYDHMKKIKLVKNKKLVEYKSKNGKDELLQELPFSIENYEKLKSSDNLVYLVDEDDTYKKYALECADLAYKDATLFYQILYDYSAYTDEEIEYFVKQIDFNTTSTYSCGVEGFSVEGVMSNKYLKDKVNQRIILHICPFVYDCDEYVDDEYNINAEKAFKDYVDIVTKAGITLGEKDLKETCIEYWDEYYEGNIKDLLNYLKI